MRTHERIYYFQFLLILSFFLLALRLAHVQLISGHEFSDLAEENRFFSKTYPAERGVILDRYDQALVKNQTNYYRLADGQQLYSEAELIAAEEGLSLLATASSDLNYDFSRKYLYPESLAHVLGYLSLVTAEDLLANRDLPFNLQLGRMGLEKQFDDLLRPVNGKEIYEVNALGEKQQLVAQLPSTLGENLKTNLDPFLSEQAYQALAGKKGAVVIMDAKNGELLSLVNSPSFDSNLFDLLRKEQLLKSQPRPAQQRLQAYLQDEQQVFFNRAISGTYPPGSVFKLVTALAALQENAIDASTIVEDEGVLTVGEWQYANWYFTQYGQVEGSVDLQKALARSNDIYFYKTSEWLGADQLANYANLFAFGERIGVELGGEATGLVPRPAWKEEERGERWFLGNTYHFGIGQGDLLVTPLQVAQMTQAIVNQGVLCHASLLRSLDSKYCENLAIDEANFNLVLAGMLGAVSSGGTAYPLFDYNQKVEALLISELGESTYQQLSLREKIDRGMLVGKTGTAEFGGLTDQGYRATHAWFTSSVGLNVEQILHNWQNLADKLADTTQARSLTANDLALQALLQEPGHQAWLEHLQAGDLPRELVITVLVESDAEKLYREGSEDAAPVVREILRWMTGL